MFKPKPPTKFPQIHSSTRMTRNKIMFHFKKFTPQKKNKKHLRGIIHSQRL